MDNWPDSSEEFVLEIAAMLRAAEMGSVSIGGAIDGLEIDILVQKGRRRGKHVTIVECKAYTKLVGSHTVRTFASVFQYLRDTGQANEGWLVAMSGFTSRSRDEAERAGVQLYTPADLREKLGLGDRDFRDETATLTRDAARPSHGKKRIFVVMPIKPEMDDVYILGIRWAAAHLGVVAQRVDDFKHFGDIVSEIQRAIREYDAVVGDTTGANPNVCYEVGFAHALNRPTVLICRKGESLPFDLQGVNHLLYPNVITLRTRLVPLLETALGV
jgi:hypothetical protein